MRMVSRKLKAGPAATIAIFFGSGLWWKVTRRSSGVISSRSAPGMLASLASPYILT